jgi:hypothetical protein
MRGRSHIQPQEVAGGRLATPSQPPRATPTHTAKASYQRTPQPIRSGLLLDTAGALQEGLRCSPASRPLPTPTFGQGKTPPIFLDRSRRVQ